VIEFSDILYGKVRIPDWLVPFLTIPEFVRLRGVRLSNVDSFQFKDFAGPSRWEHGIAVAWLALRCAERRNLGQKDRAELALAALLHDVATPPFAHTAEYVLEAFDHEIESQNLLSGRASDGSTISSAVFASQVPQFRTACQQLSKTLGADIDPDRVAEFVVGDGELGFLVHGSVDLDNADNVTRACRYLGIDVDPAVPIWLSEWLACQASAPSDLGSIREPMLAEWLRYRGELYGRFYESTDAELGRQAFLQHLMRQGLKSGLSREALIWNTDERLLFQLEQLEDPQKHLDLPSLRELVQRYRLLEAPTRIAHVELFDDSTLQTIGAPQAAGWIESHLATPYFQPFVSIIRVRHGRASSEPTLFPAAPGMLLLFKLGGPPRELQLPEWLRIASNAALDKNRAVSFAELSKRLLPRITEWSLSKPWAAGSSPRKRSVVSNLQNFGDWSFRLSRNDSLHAYPGTFVHTIPAALIASLGMQGDLVVDPFGGTGQTASEAILQGCTAVSGDMNFVAGLIAKTRLTFLGTRSRVRLRAISMDDIRSCSSASLPEFEFREKWFHEKTLLEIGQIKTYLERRRDVCSKQFLLATLSAVTTSCTGRRGKEHGYFADNTPLERGVTEPPYQDAIGLFLERIERNLRIIEHLYVQIERDGGNIEKVLGRVRVVRADVSTASSETYGLEPHCAGAVITSPPYLCMADYTLGQRLSYQLLFPDEMKDDFACEIGKRRQRFQAEQAQLDYVVGMRRFANLSATILRVGGYLATVLGTPTARNYQGWDATGVLDKILLEHGFEKVWDVWRPINWHRNHGYARLNRERVAVHVLRD